MGWRKAGHGGAWEGDGMTGGGKDTGRRWNRGCMTAVMERSGMEGDGKSWDGYGTEGGRRRDEGRRGTEGGDEAGGGWWDRDGTEEG